MLTHFAQNDKNGVDFLHGYALQAAWSLRLKMAKNNKTQIDSSLPFDENKLTAKKVLSPKSLWNLAKKQKPSFMAFCVSKFLRARASGANKFRGFL